MDEGDAVVRRLSRMAKRRAADMLTIGPDKETGEVVVYARGEFARLLWSAVRSLGERYGEREGPPSPFTAIGRNAPLLKQTVRWEGD